MYEIYGDYGSKFETLLESFDTLDAARRWVDNYTDGNMGGYHGIEVLTFTVGDGPVIHYGVYDEPEDALGTDNNEQERWYDTSAELD